MVLFRQTLFCKVCCRSNATYRLVCIYIHRSSFAPVGNSAHLLRHHGYLRRIVKNVVRAAVQDFRDIILDCRRTTAETPATHDNSTKRPMFVLVTMLFSNKLCVTGRMHTKELSKTPASLGRPLRNTPPEKLCPYGQHVQRVVR